MAWTNNYVPQDTKDVITNPFPHLSQCLWVVRHQGGSHLLFSGQAGILQPGALPVCTNSPRRQVQCWVSSDNNLLGLRSDSFQSLAKCGRKQPENVSFCVRFLISISMYFLYLNQVAIKMNFQYCFYSYEHYILIIYRFYLSFYYLSYVIYVWRFQTRISHISHLPGEKTVHVILSLRVEVYSGLLLMI